MVPYPPPLLFKLAPRYKALYLGPPPLWVVPSKAFAPRPEGCGTTSTATINSTRPVPGMMAPK